MELSDKIDVVLGGRKVGKVMSIDLDTIGHFCYGEIEFAEGFKVYSNMSFYNVLAFIDNSKVEIEINFVKYK